MTAHDFIRFLVLGLAFVMASFLGPDSGRAATRPAPTPSRTVLPKGTTLPDSVLARIGTARLVTAGGFRRSWTQVKPPARPDSLTPEGVRQFLNLLIEKEVLADHALRQGFTWTTPESAQYDALRDQMMLKAALDSALDKMRGARLAQGDSAVGVQALGIAARESTFAHRRVTYDDALLERLAMRWAALPRPSRDSSIWSQLRVMGINPQVGGADSQRVIAESEGDAYRVVDLLESWKRTNPLTRPRIETAAQVRDLVTNGLYERLLRREAQAAKLDRRPEIASALAERREYYAVAHLVDREVYKKLPTDSLALLAWYRDHVPEYDLPDRVQIVRMVLPDRAEAGRMAARLLSAAEAETLIASGRRAGVNYASEITPETDSVTARAAMRAGPGAVLGPDSVATGWQVTRVTRIQPARSRTFDEARELVQHHYYGTVGERRMRELIDRLRKTTRVVVNERGVDRLVRGGG